MSTRPWNRLASWRVRALKAAAAAVTLTAAVASVRSGLLARQTAPSAAQTREQVYDDSRPVNLAAEQSLSRVTALPSGVRSVRDHLAALSESSGVPLSAAAPLADRRITLCPVANRPLTLRTIMEAIGDVTGASWRKRELTGGRVGFELFQTESDLKEERHAIQLSAQRQVRAEALQVEALLNAVEALHAEKPPAGATAPPLLAELSRAQLEVAARLACVPDSTHQFSNPRLQNLLLAAPLSGLPAGRRGLAESFLSKGLPAEVRVAGAQAGIYCANGRLCLGVVTRESDRIWLEPSGSVQRKGIAGVDADFDMPSEVVDAVNRSRIVDLNELPRARREQIRLRFDTGLKRWLLPDVLAAIAKASGIPIVSDAFARGQKIYGSWLLTDKDEYGLEEALTQVGRATGHRFVYRKGVLRCATLTLGHDLRAEPPSEVVQRLAVKKKQRKPLTFEDCLALASLTPLQLWYLIEAQGSPYKLVDLEMPLFPVWNSHRALRLYAGLSQEQKRLSDSDEGLTAAEMTPDQRREFEMLQLSGLSEPVTDGNRRPGLFAVRRDEPGTTIWELRAVSGGASPRCAVHTFRLR